jgi:hypothetical protein
VAGPAKGWASERLSDFPGNVETASKKSRKVLLARILWRRLHDSKNEAKCHIRRVFRFTPHRAGAQYA